MTTKKMFVRSALVVAVLAVASATALAVGPHRVGNGEGAQQAVPVNREASVASESVPGLSTIYSNLGTGSDPFDPNAGLSISGPDSGFGSENWVAMPFTAPASVQVAEIALGAGYVSGTNQVVVTLYQGSGGLPGSVLGSWTMSNLSQFGGSGIPCLWIIEGCPQPCVYCDPGIGIFLTKGTQYWIGLSTGTTDQSFWGIWNFNAGLTSGTLATDVNGAGWHKESSTLPAVGLFAE
jgi:hypothetical protein